MNFSKIDNLLIGFFVFIFIASIYLLMNQNSENVRLKQANDIGTITNIKNSVKRKNINNINWHNVSEADAIQEDDVIFTSDKSSALLTFKDGSRLNIEGDSLIRLKDLKDSVEVVLEKGEIQINNQNKMRVALAGKEQQLLGLSENSIFTLSNRDNNIEIHSVQGKADMGKHGEVVNGENVNIAKGKISKPKATIKISEGRIEDNNAFIEWSNDSNLKNFSIQISEDPLFTNYKKIDSAFSPVKIAWNKPVAYVKIMSNDPNETIKRSIISKIYLKNHPQETKASRIEEESLWKNITRLYNKMLENSKRLEK